MINDIYKKYQDNLSKNREYIKQYCGLLYDKVSSLNIDKIYIDSYFYGNYYGQLVEDEATTYATIDSIIDIEKLRCEFYNISKDSYLEISNDDIMEVLNFILNYKTEDILFNGILFCDIDYVKKLIFENDIDFSIIKKKLNIYKRNISTLEELINDHCVNDSVSYTNIEKFENLLKSYDFQKEFIEKYKSDILFIGYTNPDIKKEYDYIFTANDYNLI